MRRFVSTLTVAVAAGICLHSSGALAKEPASPAAVRSFELTYTFSLKDLPQDAKEVWAWVPLPPSNERQTIKDWKVAGDVPYEVVTDEFYGNKFLRFNFSQVPAGADGKRTVSITYDASRKAYRPIDGGTPEGALSDTLMQRYLSPDKLVPLDGKIAAEATATAPDKSDPLAAARKLFDHIVDSVKYDKSGPAGTWGRGDAVFACDVRAGNCTDFHSLFIGEARSLGIPARFFMGMSIPTDAPSGAIAGYHCWAEFFTNDRGWLPIDASEASKHPDQRDKLFGGLDADRLEFSTGRDITLPGAKGSPVNFIIYPYVEIDGAAADASKVVERSFAYKNL